MEDADETGLLDVRTDLLPALARRRLPWVFVIVDESAGEAPHPKTWLDRTPAEQDPAVDLDHHGSGDLRVVPQDEVVIGTGFKLAALDDARHQLGAAFDAEVTR